MAELWRYCRYGVFLACLVAVGCQRQNSLLSLSNFLQKFNEIEAASNERPGTLTVNDVEAVLGPGQVVRPGDPSIRDLPPGAVTGDLKYLLWSMGNEQLIAGFAEGRLASVCRVRR